MELKNVFDSAFGGCAGGTSGMHHQPRVPRTFEPGNNRNLRHVMRVLQRTLESRAVRDRELRSRIREASSVSAATRNTETAMAGRQQLPAVTRIARRMAIQQINPTKSSVAFES